MNLDLNRVKSWIKQAPQQISRWPGVAARTNSGKIDMRRGRVENVTDLAILVTMDHPLHPKVKLMGDSYAHFCESCRLTIPGNVTYNRSPGSIEHKGQTIPIRFFCPYCGPDHILRMLRPGDKLLLHYRVDKGGEWAGWYAEVAEW